MRVQHAWDLGFRHIICETDSLSSMDRILKDNHIYHPHYALVHCTKDLVAADWNITFDHTHRETH
ncbi:hypothetical protein HKD37_02G004804 [Glycine soja]